MAKSPLTDNQDLVGFSILSNGKQIDDILEVTALFIIQEAGTEDLATISFRYIDSFTDTYEERKRFDAFQLGHSIEIKLGYNERIKKVFSGEVIQHQLNLSADENQLNIHCQARTPRPPYEDFDLANSKEPVLKVTWGRDIYDANLTQTRPYRLAGQVTFPGCADAQVNDAITVSDLHNPLPFESTETLREVVHIVEEGSWKTQVKIGAY